MLWIKSFHIIFMVTWFAGLFYLPRLFVYHAQSTDRAQQETFKVMERKLMIMTHLGGGLTILFGVWLLVGWLGPLMSQTWMQIKMLMVLIVMLYHAACYKLMLDFRADRNTKGHVWYRLFNEVPVLFLVSIVLLVVIRPSW